MAAFLSILAVWWLVNTVFASWFAGFGITMDSLQNIAILYSFSLDYNANTLDAYGLRFLLDFALFDVEIFSLNCISSVSLGVVASVLNSRTSATNVRMDWF